MTPTLRDHSVGSLYPYSVMGVGDKWTPIDLTKSNQFGPHRYVNWDRDNYVEAQALACFMKATSELIDMEVANPGSHPTVVFIWNSKAAAGNEYRAVYDLDRQGMQACLPGSFVGHIPRVGRRINAIAALDGMRKKNHRRVIGGENFFTGLIRCLGTQHETRSGNDYYEFQVAQHNNEGLLWDIGKGESNV